MSATFGPEEFQAATNVSRETLERLKTFVDVLVRWQSRINLIADSTLPEMWHRHILDSAQLVELGPPAGRWLDLGTGAGFPGVVIAIMKTGVPGFEMHLTERLARKCEFLSEVLAETGTVAVVHHGRLEALAPAGAAAITARACAPLEKLLEYFERHAAAGAVGLFAKGRNAAEELTLAEAKWTLDYDALPSRTGSGGQILRIRSANRRPDGPKRRNRHR